MPKSPCNIGQKSGQIWKDSNPTPTDFGLVGYMKSSMVVPKLYKYSSKSFKTDT
jgi:hypothetical protein